MQQFELTFPVGADPERLDSFLARSVAELTRSAVLRLIETGHATVNGEHPKPSLKLKGGEQVILEIPPPVPAEPQAETIPLEILYEDSELVVVNKAAGMVVHPGAGNADGTLVNALLGHCTDLSGIGGELRPGIVHRIDKDTSGVLVIAKSDRAHQHLAEQFKAHSIKRVYLALVYGSFAQDGGKIESTIGRHPIDRKKMSGKARHGKHAVTHWRVVARYPGLTLLRLRLETGRTHQIRVHLSEAGHPLVCDETYGGGTRITALKDPELKKMIKEMGRHALHAKTLGFLHPVTGSYLEFDTDLPPDLAGIISYLESNNQ
ncbi:RluA family pseudouridine synthase [Geomesophilobacter sediminis]|uniref:Pseudouridine synthase n=1 Tax=Geomesophilobacter sediminis TaxID=2798584 RepID=A0A8J7M1T2_9BACT|nr:RluA family pseudouridine synthase [Geomesophilobacter sediminis]MBJ6727077.1 RluA family pseudouridine synthase [Geomesophilobacter sediminis]